jgi:hypothetical protein
MKFPTSPKTKPRSGFVWERIKIREKRALHNFQASSASAKDTPCGVAGNT